MLLQPFHRPIHAVEQHIIENHEVFFYCTLKGEHKRWISETMLKSDSYTSIDRDIIQMYCITHDLPLFSNDSITIDLEKLSTTVVCEKPLEKKRRWCCFKQ